MKWKQKTVVLKNLLLGKVSRTKDQLLVLAKVIETCQQVCVNLNRGNQGSKSLLLLWWLKSTLKLIKRNFLKIPMLVLRGCLKN